MNLFQTLIRSWQFLVQCARFFARNKDLLFFPIISIICTIALAFILFAGGLLQFEAISHFFEPTRSYRFNLENLAFFLTKKATLLEN